MSSVHEINRHYHTLEFCMECADAHTCAFCVLFKQTDSYLAVRIPPIQQHLPTNQMGNDSNLSCIQYPQDQYKEIAAARAATGTISIAIGALAIFINVVNKKNRFQFHLMSVGAVLAGISRSFTRLDYFVQNKATVTICAAIGFVDTYALWIILLSTVALACNLSADFNL